MSSAADGLYRLRPWSQSTPADRDITSGHTGRRQTPHGTLLRHLERERRIFTDATLLEVSETGDGLLGIYSFVLG
jgi:hypothetical protein